MKENLGVFYDNTSDFQQAQFMALSALIRETVADPGRVTSLLDIGAGTGSRTLQSMALFRNICAAVAIEPDWDMISVAKRQYADPRLTYLMMPAEEMGAKLVPEKHLSEKHLPEKNHFDAVISNWALHWVSNKEKLMSDIGDMTDTGSLFMFSTCERLPRVLSMIDEYIRNEFRIVDRQASPFHYLSLPQWQALLESHGWGIKGSASYPVHRDIDNTRDYIDHWFTASAAKFMYGKHLAELSPLSHSDLVWMITMAFPSAQHAAGMTFTEDVMFIVAEKG